MINNLIIIGILLLLASIGLQEGNNTASSQSPHQSIDVASGEIVTEGGAVTYYTFIIPEAAVDPRLIGHYEVADGQTVRVQVLEQEGCPSPLSSSDCTSIYSAPNKDRGDVNVGLTPGKT